MELYYSQFRPTPLLEGQKSVIVIFIRATRIKPTDVKSNPQPTNQNTMRKVTKERKAITAVTKSNNTRYDSWSEETSLRENKNLANIWIITMETFLENGILPYDTR